MAQAIGTAEGDARLEAVRQDRMSMSRQMSEAQADIERRSEMINERWDDTDGRRNGARFAREDVEALKQVRSDERTAALQTMGRSMEDSERYRTALRQADSEIADAAALARVEQARERAATPVEATRVDVHAKAEAQAATADEQKTSALAGIQRRTEETEALRAWTDARDPKDLNGTELARKDAKAVAEVRPDEHAAAMEAIGRSMAASKGYETTLRAESPEVARAALDERERRELASATAAPAVTNARDAGQGRDINLASVIDTLAQTRDAHESQSKARDGAALQAIERKTEALWAARDQGTLTTATQRDHARHDAEQLAAVEDKTERQFAAGTVGENAREHTAYREELQRLAPQLAVEAEAAAREGDRRSAEKEDRKAAQYGHPNAIEPVTRREPQAMDADGEARRAAWLRKGEVKQTAQPADKVAFAPRANQVESDEVFTAMKSDVKPVVSPEAEQRYTRVGDTYYDRQRKDEVAFVDKGSRLESPSNSERIAETMVHIAKARGWDEIKVSGSEAFRREAWLEAAANGMHVKGYNPSEQDKAELNKRAPQVDAAPVAQAQAKPTRAAEVEAPVATPAPPPPTADQTRAREFTERNPSEAVRAHPELAGAYAAARAIELECKSQQLPPEALATVNSRVRRNIANAIEQGANVQVTVREQREIERPRATEVDQEATR